jgi:carbon storage regulator CsrA
MLVVSRKSGQQIVVPQCQLAVTVLAVEGSRVRLGIRAPTEIAVFREEIWLKLRPHIDAWSQETAEQPLLDTLAAELADVAYAVALRARTENSWLKLELSLWKALAKSIKMWVQELSRTIDQSKVEPTNGLDGHDCQLDERCCLIVGEAGQA